MHGQKQGFIRLVDIRLMGAARTDQLLPLSTVIEVQMRFPFLVTELLGREGISTDTWREIVLALSLEAVNEVRPRPGLDPIDIRSLIKIKKLPGGDPTDSSIIPGEVFTLRVHQRDLVTRYGQELVSSNAIIIVRSAD